jgi:hypothetical protein
MTPAATASRAAQVPEVAEDHVNRIKMINA